MLKAKFDLQDRSQLQIYKDRNLVNELTVNIHKAVQWIARVANAYELSVGNDKHGTIRWNSEQKYFYGRPFSELALRLAFRPTDFSWLIMDEHCNVLDLLKGIGVSDEKVWGWLQKNLIERRIDTNKLHYDLPYILPYAHHISSIYSGAAIKTRSFFAKIHTTANYILESALTFTGLKTKAEGLYIWPNEMDVSNFIPIENTGDNKVNAIEIGMATRDHIISEHYLYIKYEAPDVIFNHQKLPDLPSAGYWLNIDDWSGAVLPMSNLRDNDYFQLEKGILFIIAAIEAFTEH
jgi:hypothetical protein